MHKLTVLFKRAQHILQTEGFVSLIRRGLAFIRSWVFQHEVYYLYEHEMKERNEADFMPRVRELTVEIVFTNRQADELAAKGLEFRSPDGRDRDRLDDGAIAFCFFVGQELAHKGWVALTEKAQKSIAPLPHKVDYSKNEAYCGGTFSNPEFRGNGLMTYGYYKRLQFLREAGRTVSRNTVAKDNIASHKALARLKPTINAQARYLKILGFKFWKETPLQTTPF